MKIQKNTNKFLVNKNKLNQEDIINLIGNEINSQLNNNTLNLSRSQSDCYATLQIGSSRCERNFAIGIAGLAISSFFTFGLGTVVGAVAIGTILNLCGNDIMNDYNDCMAN